MSYFFIVATIHLALEHNEIISNAHLMPDTLNKEQKNETA